MSIADRVTLFNSEPTTLNHEAIGVFAEVFRGQLIQPGDAEYEEARRVWNSMIDKRPALIARCNSTTDVVAALRFAREQGLEIAVRGGGHNVAGNAVNDGGLVIDLSPMKGIQVDPVKRIAHAQPGVNWGELDHETQKFGLATPGGVVSTTGIAGFTLSGGMALTSRKWGLACDNLLSVEVVTVEGEVLQASMTEHPDLFWGIRGGGGNFGIVTRFEYQLHAIGPEIAAATTIYALDDAREVMRGWRKYVASAPDEVTSVLSFWSMPPLPDLPVELHGAPIVIAWGAYAGQVHEGEQALQPLRELATPIVDLTAPATYLHIQSAFDAFFPTTLRYYWKSLFLDELTEADIAQTIALAADRPSPQTLFALRHLGGAISQIPDDATAYANRRAQFNLSLDATWADPADDERMIGWVQRAWQELRERTGGGVYLNFAGLGEENELLARAGHGSNYERLRAVKRRYDPDNIFRGNINIKP
jgi:FAD/FMN-containing dehydrogenase